MLRLRLAADLKVLLCLAVAALALPVLMTTAAPQETQAFVLVYFLGLGFLLDELVGLVIPKLGAESSTIPGHSLGDHPR